MALLASDDKIYVAVCLELDQFHRFFYRAVVSSDLLAVRLVAVVDREGGRSEASTIVSCNRPSSEFDSFEAPR
jgi:hypothetical protein